MLSEQLMDSVMSMRVDDAVETYEIFGVDPDKHRSMLQRIATYAESSIKEDKAHFVNANKHFITQTKSFILSHFQDLTDMEALALMQSVAAYMGMYVQQNHQKYRTAGIAKFKQVMADKERKEDENGG